jgi:serine/threonine-protein kinase
MEVDEIVHRDLKPDNVLFHEGAWKIADFGIARFIEEATRSSTLKDCLTQEYAAPEQWRSERATHATDIYALGCIGFCLLTGGPPFTTDPSEQHQQSPVPSFECADPRLRTLITLMLRKLAPTRPTLLRVEQLLTEIVQHPYTDSSSNAASLLAAVGAEVGIQEQQREAAAEADRRVSQERSALGRAAIEVLSDNLERLWGRIHSNAPNATRHGGAGFQLQCLLGRAVLEAYLPQPTEVCAKGELPKAGWDLVLRGFIRVYGITGVPQGANGVVWVAILLYAKAKGKADYRWHEVSFSKAMDSVPFCSPTSVDADRALALGNRPVLITVEQHVTRIAHGPLEVDDEKEAEFHERWIWLLATAAKNELGYPADIPFSWPPRMLR